MASCRSNTLKPNFFCKVVINIQNEENFDLVDSVQNVDDMQKIMVVLIDRKCLFQA